MWNIFMDVSGMPPDDIYIGMFMITENYKNLFLTEFFDAFPEAKHYSKKSTTLGDDVLFDILNFFNNKRLRMTCYHFKNFQWKLYERKINELLKEVNPSHKYTRSICGLKEKVIGILYYYAICRTVRKEDECEVTVCAEGYMDIFQVINTIQKLAHRDGRNFKITAQWRKFEPMLKMSDYIAGANRKIDELKLGTISRLEILKDPIRDFDLKKVFKIYLK